MAIRAKLLYQIKNAISRRGWNQKDMAEASGIHQNTISAILNNNKPVTLKTLYKIIDAFDCELVMAEKSPPPRRNGGAE